MRPYQLAGLNWMIRLRHNGLTASSRTRWVWARRAIDWQLGYLEEFIVKGPHLVLVPKTTLSGWQNEFARWLPSLKILTACTTKDERSTWGRSSASSGPGTSFNNLRSGTIEVRGSASKTRRRGFQRREHRSSMAPSRDRAAAAQVNASRGALALPHHRRGAIKRAGAALEDCQLLKTENRLLVPRPLQNNLHELWALLNFHCPTCLPRERFDELFNSSPRIGTRPRC